jgi:hypothetical protein
MLSNGASHMSKKEVKELPPPPPNAERQPTWEEVVKMLFEKSPDPLHEITDTIIQAIRGRPETIKAEYDLKKYTMLASFFVICAILFITTILCILGKLSGDTIAFIFGTAFGTVITFLYRYLSGKGD